MTTRVSKQYKPVEYSHSYSNSSNNSVNSNIPTINTTQQNSTAAAAGQILTQIFGAFTTSSKSSAPADETTAAKAKKKEEKEEEVKPEDAVKELVKDFDKQSEDVQKDLINKYSSIKNVTPNITNERLETRLNNYLKALNAHKIELEMGKVFAETMENGDITETWKNCDLKIVDEDIAKANDVTTDEFFTTRENRGAGYIELYDADGDEVVTFDEFKALEEKDYGQTLNEEQLEATQSTFNRIDKDNNGKIDSIEMASHLYAMSRIFDEGANGTTSDITFKEYCATSTEVGTNDDYTIRYNGRSDELYNALINRQK